VLGFRVVRLHENKMQRRSFIAQLAGAASWAPAARAQQKATPVVGFLRAGQPPKSWIEAFRQGLRERQYVDGQNVVVEFRFSGGNVDQLTYIAEELVRSKVDVILASAAPAAQAAEKATKSVPVVFVAANPVEMGLVQSLTRPGGNLTGLAENPTDLAGKRLELLREMVPALRRIAVLWDRGNPSNPGQLEGVEVAARMLGMQFEPVAVEGPNDFDSGFKRGADGLLVLNSLLFTTHRALLVGLAATSRLPAVYGYREVVEAGGLMSARPNARPRSRW
jgi:putative tryptophan/tyrosine transport system substrate-binding protein